MVAVEGERGMDRVLIFDTTLRDGEQSPGATLNLQEKLAIAHQLARLGVDIIEAGFPASSPGDFAAVRRIAEEVKGPIIAGLARANRADIDRAWAAVQAARRPRIHTFLATSDIHLQHKLKMTRDDVRRTVAEMVAYARQLCPDVEFSPEDAGRSDREFLADVVRIAIEAGATTINIPDTVGYTMPEEFGGLIRYLCEHVSGLGDAVVLSVHTHDDLGLAVANALAGVRAGARQVECTINGIGERAGNCSLEEVVMALHTRQEFFGLTTGIDTTQIYKTSRMVSTYTGIVVQPNKAIVGANAFAHEAGIHQDGVLKERTTYEIMDARAVGLASNRLVLGKHSGRHAFKKRLEELGFNLSPEELNRAFARFKELCDKKKEITDRDLEALVADEIMAPTQVYKLAQVQVSCGSQSIPTATVRIIDPEGRELVDAALGTGPVDAVYQAINRVIRVPNRLTEFSIQAVTGGIDAIGEVTIRIESDGRTFTGRGASTDIIVAASHAYMNALNKLLTVRANGQNHDPVRHEDAPAIAP
jgi:2-isopropylmalate synthase